MTKLEICHRDTFFASNQNCVLMDYEKYYLRVSPFTIDLVTDKEKLIDGIICETNEKLVTIAEEIREIKFSTLDESSKELKLELLREEFQKILDEQQKRVLKITNP